MKESDTGKSNQHNSELAYKIITRNKVILGPASTGYFHGINFETLSNKEMFLETFSKELEENFKPVNILESIELEHKQQQEFLKHSKANILLKGVWIPAAYKLPVENYVQQEAMIRKIVIKPASAVTDLDLEKSGISQQHFFGVNGTRQLGNAPVSIIEVGRPKIIIDN